MKSYKKYILPFLALGISGMMLSSCTDYLDKAPESDISETEAFKNFRNFQGYTEELYFCIPDFAKAYWTNSFNWGDDEIINVGVDYHMGYKIDNGDFWGWQAEHDGWQCGWMDLNNRVTDKTDPSNAPSLWKNSWYGIRKCNMGLANLNLFTEGTKEERNIIEGQLLFFRGWFHFQLIQYFGGLPYIDYVLPAGEKLTLPRLSYHECAEKIDADFKRAAELLPVDWDKCAAGAATKGNNQIRINKIMALGYQGKNLLWAASPLMNKVSTGSATYNQDYAKRAAEVFGQLLKMVENGETQYALVDFKDYPELFTTVEKNGIMPGLTEAIFRGPSTNWDRGNWNQTSCYQTKCMATRSGVQLLPCANYVNFYGMKNGLPLTDKDSQFDKSHPWKDRDPRFYNDIRYDGCKVEIGGNASADKYRYAPLYTGGALRDPIDGSRTGYLNYKFIRDNFNRWDDGFSWGHHAHMHISWMRLADVYLMYAEAAAQAQGASKGTFGCELSALDAVNKIRARAGVDPVADKYSATLDGFMSELRRERAVELAFEGHRFNDLRRWLLLTHPDYIKKTSQEFQRVGDITGVETDSSKGLADKKNPQENEVIGFTEKVILTRNFSDKHYWLPLKINDTSMYLEFAQNPGW